jgi:Domain of unknown function (DUF4190)
MSGMTEHDTTTPPRPDLLRPTAAGAHGFSSTETNTLAVFPFFVSLLWLFGLGSLAAIVLGLVARGQIRRTGGRQPGAGLAMTGIVIGSIGLIATIVFFVMLMIQVEHETL